MGGGAVVALQPDHLRARKVPLEAQDVVYLRPPPAVDRLVIVTDAAHVFSPLSQQAQPKVLGDVGVLVLVHQNVFEAAVEILQHVVVLTKEGQVVQQEIAEVAGVQGAKPLLIAAIEHDALAAAEIRPLRRRNLVGRPAAVLPMVDQAGEGAGRPALGVDVRRLDQLLQQPFLIVGV